MEIKKAVFILFALIIFSTVYAQSKFKQELKWGTDKNAFEYSVEIVSAVDSSKKYNFKTETASVTFSIPAGKYKYRIHAFDMLGREAQVSEWKEFEIHKAFEPKIKLSSPKTNIIKKSEKEMYIPVDVEKVTPESVISLVNTENGKIINGRISKEIISAEDGKMAEPVIVAVFPNVKEGSWKVKVTNPGGLSSESEVMNITAYYEEKKKEAAVLAEKIKKEKEAEEKRRAEELKIARETEEKRRAEELRLAKEAEEAKKAEEKRIAEELKKQKEAEEARRAEELKLARETEEKRRAEELRLAKEAEEAKKAEEKRIAEELKKQKETEKARKAEEEKLAKEAEELRKSEEKKKKAGKVSKEFNLYAAGSYLIPLYDQGILEDIGMDSMLCLGAKTNLCFAGKKSFVYGLELGAKAAKNSAASSDADYSIVLYQIQANFMMKRKLGNKTSLEIWFGPDVLIENRNMTFKNVYRESPGEKQYGYVGGQIGSGISYNFLKFAAIKAGCEYSHIVTSSGGTGFISPEVCFGFKF